MSEKELAICRRLRGLRQDKKLSQVAFSNLLGIDSSRLASYEHGRVPLRFDVAVKIGNVTGVSLKWLAEGIEPKYHPFKASEKLLAEIPLNSLFSDAWLQLVKPVFEKELAETDRWLSGNPVDDTNTNQDETSGGDADDGFVSVEVALGFLNQNLRLILEMLPPHLYQSFRGQLRNAWIEFLEKNMVEIQKWSIRKADREKDNLDKSAAPANLSGMKPEVPTWPELKEDIKKMTAERGAKKALADDIKVSRQVLGNWLSDDAQGAPNAVLTLELLKRVQQWKRKK